MQFLTPAETEKQTMYSSGVRICKASDVNLAGQLTSQLLVIGVHSTHRLCVKSERAALAQTNVPNNPPLITIVPAD